VAEIRDTVSAAPHHGFGWQDSRHENARREVDDLTVELKGLRLHGMAGAWVDLVEQGSSAGLDTSRWLVEHLLQAETTDRAMRSVTHQMFNRHGWSKFGRRGQRALW